MILHLRTKLLASFLLVIITGGTIAAIIGVRLVGTGIVKQAQEKVELDLNTARLIYAHAASEVLKTVRYTAGRFFLKTAVSQNDIANVAAELIRVMHAESLDFLNLTDIFGNVLFRAGNPAVKGDSQAHRLILSMAMSSRKDVVSTDITAREDLLKDGPELAERASLDLVATPHAKTFDVAKITSGMTIEAASPILDAGGNVTAFLHGGTLINGDFRLVDKIKSTVYPDARYGGKDVGTATIFLHDVRVSTNVMTEEGVRAIGTRVSEDVYRRVLLEGQPWIQRAFVVNDWYFTAYEPITNATGERIGILYVGLLEKRYADMRRNALLMFIGITLAGVVLSIVICFFLTRSLVRPVNRLLAAANGLASGDLLHQVEIDTSTEEIAALGRAFNTMALSIKERDRQLRKRAQEEISKSERLALIGRLAAGVAHEINNPLGGILLLSNILLKRTPDEGRERDNLERIVKEADRAKNIVQGLLDFARQREPVLKNTNINELAERSLELFEHQASFHNIKIVKEFADNMPAALVDPSQIQQVFVNIIVNAAEAMKDEGTLTVITRATPMGEIEVHFRDTGEGISEDVLPRLFEPFFTTKEIGKGTGLGLSISHGIVEKHGGSMSVSSILGAGTTFIIKLPSAGSEER
ncbi:MAG: cache domain-containing protein [Spirochaetales bacterium]|nr:cache domain-containing protein [Spirochaetales bacterium]